MSKEFKVGNTVKVLKSSEPHHWFEVGAICTVEVVNDQTYDESVYGPMVLLRGHDGLDQSVSVSDIELATNPEGE